MGRLQAVPTTSKGLGHIELMKGRERFRADVDPYLGLLEQGSLHVEQPFDEGADLGLQQANASSGVP